MCGTILYESLYKVLFVKTTENDADLFNKNLPAELHKKHAMKLLSEKGETKES